MRSVELRLRPWLARQRIRTAAELSRRLQHAGVPRARETVWRLTSKRQRSISFEVLGGLCEVLKCEPGDFLARADASGALDDGDVPEVWFDEP